ncbi:hypothetical protein SCP_1500260 [Sparassis crispa]|uniref:Uncharacterized protein n=1 Tax=Sparassis crispa TaxID=139825 RepID=A0A401H3N1_9APHY|nr:hypothetical protein SCP_1500260 [Sparassis crispa]GBE89024.1 hypothetical protein SCP_1500260 [Sparassis crispa]
METLKQDLKLADGQDLSVALISLITSAVREDHAAYTLQQLSQSISHARCAAALEPLTLLPLLISCPYDGADKLIHIMGQESSAKEVVMAVQEVAEHLEYLSQADEQVEGVDHGLSPLKQIDRLVRLYAQCVPRLPRRNKLPSQVMKPLLSELASLITQFGGSADDDGRALVASVSESVLSIDKWVSSDSAYDVDERSRCGHILAHLLYSTVEACVNSIQTNLARVAFANQFPRLVVPNSAGVNVATGDDVVSKAWSALDALGVTPSNLESRPSRVALVLLAHLPSYTLSLPLLTSFFPVILTSVQANVALDEVLYHLISSIGPLRLQYPRPDLPSDLIVPLAQLLPQLAGVHPDPSTRHQTFRLLSTVLSLTPSPMRLHLLHELLTDSDLSPQMRVAAVGLVKEAVLEALATAPGSAESDRNVFVSPMFLRALGPLILRPHPPDLFASDDLSLDEFLETPEPLRLVECLAFLYVLLQRDTQNRTGIRDPDTLKRVNANLLLQLRGRLASWNEEMGGSAIHGDHAVMQLGILDMWLDRITSALESISNSGV